MMTIENTIFHEDCLKTLKRDLEYDYVITSPPDFEEIGMNPKQMTFDYYEFLSARLNFFRPKNGVYTILISDRRFDGRILEKSKLVSDLCGYDDLLSHKIWVKSYKTNLYRPNFVHILTFGQKKHRTLPPIPDVFYDEFKSVGKYRDNFSLAIVKQLILAYTNEQETVFDPFIGSGTTALACLQIGRKYIGSEIDPEVVNLCNERINEQATARKMAPETWSSSKPDQETQEIFQQA